MLIGDESFRESRVVTVKAVIALGDELGGRIGSGGDGSADPPAKSASVA